MQAIGMESDTAAQSAGPNRHRHILGSPLVVALAALLVLQLLAALVLGLAGGDMEPAPDRGPLLAFERDRVTGIRIEVPDGDPVLVGKTETGWVIPALGDLPAAEHRVTGLLSKLNGLQKGLPVATSEQARKRFKVAEDRFERRLTLEDGDDTLVTLYLGDSAGFRRLFVRADGDGSVYEAEIGLFDVPETAGDWSDRTLLHLDEEDIRQLRLGGLTLDRADEGWRLSDLAEGEEQDNEAIEAIVRRLANLDFMGVFAKGEEPEVSDEPAPVEIEAVLANGNSVKYRFAKLEEGGDYLLEVSNRPQRFTLASYAAEDLAGLGRADLLKAKESATEDTAESTPEQAGEIADAEPQEAAAEPRAIEAPEAAEAPALGPTAGKTQTTPEPEPDPGTPAGADVQPGP